MAIVSHTAWKKHLHDFVDSGKKDYEPDPKHTEFMQWLVDNETELSQYSEYKNIVELQIKLEEIAEVIVNDAQTGNQAVANEKLAYGNEFDSLSKQFVQTIICWHDKISGKA